MVPTINMGQLTETFTETDHRTYIAPGIILKISAQAFVLSTLLEAFGTIIHHLLLLRLQKLAFV